MKQVIKKNISLGRFTNAWTLCQVLKDSDVMEELAKAAMKRLGNIIISIDYSINQAYHVLKYRVIFTPK